MVSEIKLFNRDHINWKIYSSELSTKFETLINTTSNDEWLEEIRPSMKKLSSAMGERN